MGLALLIVLLSGVAAELYYPEQWDNTKANRTLQFHIFSRKNQTGHEVVLPPAKPDDYELFPGIGYYKFHHDDRATFDEAFITCAKEGGHLMIINSEEESKVAQILFSRHRNAGPWAFIGEPLKDTGFANWSSADPNNYGGNENCGSVLPNGLLGDIRCDDALAFFCEYDLSWLDP
ncbi:hypothetical protein J437_LFUL013199 [Ladona fulva]|uniref:C-type lectin domain-containing protein n=1 Tax=Ladona fulva TaxID=123851 RepID=A0A8K0KF64_LADFU|nr:hypothetical protein J437_LFUL013199 [Ladona fulva]